MATVSRHALRLSAGLFIALVPTSAGAAAQEDVLNTLFRQDSLVEEIGYTLAASNQGLCLHRARLLGFRVSAATQYAPAYRESYSALTRDDGHFVISALVPASPAQRAGLRNWDRLVAVDGNSVAPPAPGGEANVTPITSLLARLAQVATDGNLSLTVKRGDMLETIAFTLAEGCDLNWQVSVGESQQASTDGRLITLNSGLVASAADSAEIAFVLGHEMAHTLYGDPQSKRNGSAALERRADVVGLYLAARAGFDPAAGARFMMRFSRSHPMERIFGGSHAAGRKRLRLLENTAATIASKRAAGELLWPDDIAPPSAQPPWP